MVSELIDAVKNDGRNSRFLIRKSKGWRFYFHIPRVTHYMPMIATTAPLNFHRCVIAHFLLRPSFLEPL
jgi:hypothetical protein